MNHNKKGIPIHNRECQEYPYLYSIISPSTYFIIEINYPNSERIRHGGRK